MKEKTKFTQYVESVGKALGEPRPDVSEQEIFSSKTAQLCAPIHEECLRRFVLSLVRWQNEAARKARDIVRLELAATLLERYTTAPKANMVAYLTGHCEASRHTDKKALYRTLEKLGAACKLNTH
jgi:hypothetical protein